MLSASPFCGASDDASALEMSATEPTSTAQRLARLELMNIALAARLEILEGPAPSDERKEGEPAPAAPPSKAGAPPAAAAAAAAVALPKPPPSEEETRAEHVRELAEALEEQLRESYYGRVQVSLLLLAHKSALGEPLRAAHVLFVLSKFGLVFFLCFLQNIALAVVMDEQVRERERSLSAENVLPF